MSLWKWLGFSALFGLLAGAGLLALSLGDTRRPAAAPTPPGPAPSPPSRVLPVDGAELKRALEANRGKVVVLNLWATWCAPCVEEFPALVRLSEGYKAQGVVLMAVSLDDPADRPKVDAFLAEHAGDYPAYLRKRGSLEDYLMPIVSDWTGAAPTTFLYNRAGRRAGPPLMGQQTYAQIEKALRSALK